MFSFYNGIEVLILNSWGAQELGHNEPFFKKKTPHVATWYKIISSIILPLPCFHNLNHSRKSIMSFYFDHTLLSYSYSFKLSLNDSPLFTQHNNPLWFVTSPTQSSFAIVYHTDVTTYYLISIPPIFFLLQKYYLKPIKKISYLIYYLRPYTFFNFIFS